MTDGFPVVDQIEQDLAALLSAVEPSAAFVPAVRRQAAAQSVRGFPLGGVVWITAMAAGALTLVLLGVVRRETTSGAVPPTVPSRSVDLVQPSLARASVSEAHESAHAERARLRSSGAVRPPASNDVVVPADEQTALVRFIEGLQDHRASVPASFGPREDADGQLVPPEAVTIVPLPDPAPVRGDRPGG